MRDAEENFHEGKLMMGDRGQMFAREMFTMGYGAQNACDRKSQGATFMAIARK